MKTGHGIQYSLSVILPIWTIRLIICFKYLFLKQEKGFSACQCYGVITTETYLAPIKYHLPLS